MSNLSTRIVQKVTFFKITWTLSYMRLSMLSEHKVLHSMQTSKKSTLFHTCVKIIFFCWWKKSGTLLKTDPHVSCTNSAAPSQVTWSVIGHSRTVFGRAGHRPRGSAPSETSLELKKKQAKITCICPEGKLYAKVNKKKTVPDWLKTL